MSEPIRGKRALITGASRGIGKEIARALAQAGSTVLICGRDSRKVEQTVLDLKKETSDAQMFGVAADVSSNRDVERLFESADRLLGGLDILVNNAGVGVFRAAGEMSPEEWDRVIGTNLSGAFYCTRAALERFGPQGGSIINISSLAGRNPFAGGAAYNASKFGLNALSEVTMLDHRYDNVRVSYIMPGSVDTEFGGSEAQIKSSWKIAPEDVAEIVVDILKMHPRTLISRVEVRPSRPQKN